MPQGVRTDSVQRTISLDAKLLREIRRAAAAEGLTISAFIAKHMRKRVRRCYGK